MSRGYEQHGRRHGPNGSDPIEGVGGIQFTDNGVYGSTNEGDGLTVLTNNGNLFLKAINPAPLSGLGLIILEAGGGQIFLAATSEDGAAIRLESPGYFEIGTVADGTLFAVRTDPTPLIDAAGLKITNGADGVDPTDFATVGQIGTLEVTDGSTTVDPVTAIELTGAVVTDGGGGVAQVNVTGGGGGSGEIAYTEITSTVNITGTTSAGATAVLSPGAVTFDGSMVVVSVFCPAIVCDTGAAADLFKVALFEGSTEIGILGFVRSLVTATKNEVPFFAQYRFAPSAGTHTYEIRCYVTSTTGTPQFVAGSGGTNSPLPAFVRFEFA